MQIDADRVTFPTTNRGPRLAAAVVLILGGLVRGAEVVLRGQQPLGIAAGAVAVALGITIAVRVRSAGPWVDAEGWHAPGRGRNRLIPWDEVTKVRVVANGERALWGLETDPDRGPLTRWAQTGVEEASQAVAAIEPWARGHGTELVDLTSRQRRG